MVVANPFVDDMDELTYIFQEEEDARLWMHVVGKTPAHQDHKLDIESDTFRALLKDIEEEMGRFNFAAVSHDEAPNLFEHYDDILKTKYLEDDPTLQEDPRLQEE